jgi:hypothetical protein
MIDKRIAQLKCVVEKWDRNACGDAPIWLRERLFEIIMSIQVDDPKTDIESRIGTFRLGAIRYIADNCGAECEMLLKTLSDICRRAPN